jgi:hypothetical protein
MYNSFLNIFFLDEYNREDSETFNRKQVKLKKCLQDRNGKRTAKKFQMWKYSRRKILENIWKIYIYAKLYAFSWLIWPDFILDDYKLTSDRA